MQSRHRWANDGAANDPGDEISMEQLHMNCRPHWDQITDAADTKNQNDSDKNFI